MKILSLEELTTDDILIGYIRQDLHQDALYRPKTFWQLLSIDDEYEEGLNVIEANINKHNPDYILI